MDDQQRAADRAGGKRLNLANSGTTGGRRTTRGLSRCEWAGLAFALLFAHAAFIRKVLYTGDCCDAYGYRELARRISNYGLFSASSFSDFRTYGYPLFLSAINFLSQWTSIPDGWMILEVQLSLYLIGSWLLRNEIRRISGGFGRWVFIGLCLNVFVLAYTAEFLTEGITLSLAVLVGSCWLWSVRRFRSKAWILAASVGGVLAGFAVMIRPANVFLPTAWIAGQVTLALSRRAIPHSGAAARRIAVLALMLIATAAPFVPQFYNNIVFGNAVTPLVASSLGSYQMSLGISNLKYTTGRPPIPVAPIPYLNPFANPVGIDPSHPWWWYWHNPAAGAKTVLLHGFALLDQDFPFPYVVDLSPPYRIPLTLFNHAAIGLAAYALWLWIRSALCPGVRRPIFRISLPVAALYIVGVFVLYGATAVEARFGLPLILVAAPLGAAAIRDLRGMAVPRLVLASIVILLYAGVALAASEWMRSQSPLIASWERHERNLALGRPARQSSTFGAFGPAKGVDGVWSAPGVLGGFHTEKEPEPWWEVDLGDIHRLTQVRVYNIPPYERAATLRLLLSQDDTRWSEVYRNGGRPFQAGPLIIRLNGKRARYVRVQLNGPTWLHLDEVEVYESLR